MNFIVNILLQLYDKKYADFQYPLIHDKNIEFIGVRSPTLRKLAKEIINGVFDNEFGGNLAKTFLRELPHRYFDENLLHGFIISEIKDFEKCIKELKLFLPYINNWAICDQTSPKVFKKHTNELLPHIYKWLESEHIYTVRFGIGMLMKHFLNEKFDVKYLDKVTSIRSDEYYIRMEIAWYMATALAKQWDSTIIYIKGKTIDKWVHNKAIQKAIESYKVTPKQKEYLKTLKIK